MAERQTDIEEIITLTELRTLAASLNTQLTRIADNLEKLVDGMKQAAMASSMGGDEKDADT